MLNPQIISSDPGNNRVKVIAQALKQRFSFANILAPAPEHRGIIKKEKESLDTLHFRVDSEALDGGGGIFAAGKLATRFTNKLRETSPDNVKVSDDQFFIMTLLSSALGNALFSSETNKTIDFHCLGTIPLPLKEIQSTKGDKLITAFKNRLTQYPHKITFLETTGLEDVTINLVFEDIVIGVEGYNAAYDLSTPNSSTKSPLVPEIFDLNVLLSDIGGGSTENLVLNQGVPDNENSRGENIGINKYIDEIYDQIESRYGYRPKNRQYLIDRIIQETYKVKVKGVEKPVKDIVDAEFRNCSLAIFDRMIDPVWKKVDDLDVTIPIGGGSLALREPLKQLMDKAEYPYKFIENPDDPEAAVWLNAQGGYKLAVKALKEGE